MAPLGLLALCGHNTMSSGNEVHPGPKERKVCGIVWWHELWKFRVFDESCWKTWFERSKAHLHAAAEPGILHMEGEGKKKKIITSEDFKGNSLTGRQPGLCHGNNVK